MCSTRSKSFSSPSGLSAIWPCKDETSSMCEHVLAIAAKLCQLMKHLSKFVQCLASRPAPGLFAQLLNSVLTLPNQLLHAQAFSISMSNQTDCQPLLHAVSFPHHQRPQANYMFATKKVMGGFWCRLNPAFKACKKVKRVTSRRNIAMCAVEVVFIFFYALYTIANKNSSSKTSPRRIFLHAGYMKMLQIVCSPDRAMHTCTDLYSLRSLTLSARHGLLNCAALPACRLLPLLLQPGKKMESKTISQTERNWN